MICDVVFFSASSSGTGARTVVKSSLIDVESKLQPHYEVNIRCCTVSLRGVKGTIDGKSVAINQSQNTVGH